MSYIYIILAFFAPRLKILGGFFVYFSVLSLSPKLQNNYYEIWFTVMMCHQPSLIYNYLYKILVTFQFSTLQNCCCCLGGGVCVGILTWSLQKIFWSCLMFCICIASVTLKIAFTRQSWTCTLLYFVNAIARDLLHTCIKLYLDFFMSVSQSQTLHLRGTSRWMWSFLGLFLPPLDEELCMRI